MSRSRSAHSTIKGYFYQLDHFILQLLKLENENDSITVEGIEDVDIHRPIEIELVQCKYYETTEYNHSIISEAVRHMYDHYQSSKGNNKYSIYGHYKSGQDKLLNPITTQFFRDKFLALKAFEGVAASDEDIVSFLSHLSINNNAMSYDEQENEILTTLKTVLGCNDFVAENHCYNNAIRIVKELAVKMNEQDRKITKKSFIEKIDHQDALFNQWFIAKKGEDQYYRSIKREYFSNVNLSPNERFFLIDIDNNISSVEIKSLIIKISEKYSKLSQRAVSTFCPYIYLNNVDNHKMLEVLKLLTEDGICFIDGYDYLNADFSVKSITKAANYHNGIKFKMVYELDDLQNIYSQISKTREIYQFHIDSPYCDNTEHKHVKIPISKTSEINKII